MHLFFTATAQAIGCLTAPIVVQRVAVECRQLSPALREQKGSQYRNSQTHGRERVHCSFLLVVNAGCQKIRLDSGRFIYRR